MNNLIDEKVTSLLQQINIAKEQWLYDCLQKLYPGIPFDKAKLSKIITENKLTIIKLSSDTTFTQEFLAFSYDFIKDSELKYIAEFKVTKDTKELVSEMKYNVQYTLPKFNESNEVLKTKLTFKNNSF